MFRNHLDDAVNIWDLRRLARQRLPRAVFDYIDGGADDEVTLHSNCNAFRSVTFRPRQAVTARTIDLRTSVIGASIEMPILLAPVGSSRLFFPEGEIRAANAAHSAGLVYILSTLSGCRLEDVRERSGGSTWYQLYLAGGRDAAKAAIARARAAGYSALVITVDTPVAGMRERDVRNRVTTLVNGNVWQRLPHVGEFLSKPRWLAGYLKDGGLMRFENVVVPGAGPMQYADITALLATANVTWDDLAWIRDCWPGPLVIKGLLTAEDAARAVEAGVNAIVVSNHGGRQLDEVAPTLCALSEVVREVRGRCDVLMDGGVRHGSDVVKALALGARAVLVGRAYAWGLAAAGERGVIKALDILREQMIRTLTLLGCESIRDLNASYLNVPAEWTRPTEAKPWTLA
jgi:L-lactate dehydrogenase (cytochrome)